MHNLLKISDGDPFDPNNWVDDDHEHRIYTSDALLIYAVVDWVDYIVLCKCKWSIHSRTHHNGQTRGQLYLRRSVSERLATDGPRIHCPVTDKVTRNRKRFQRNQFLHQAVMERTGIPKPTPSHHLVDHIDRDSLNCRRANLRWATHKQNAINKGKGEKPWV